MTTDFDGALYLNLGTFRKTGVRVDTPVWFAEEGDFFYVLSNNQAGKVKRLTNSSRCQIAPCTMLGKVTGSWHDSEAVLLTTPADCKKAHKSLHNKYGWQMRMLDAGAWVGGKINQRSFLRINKPD